MKKCPYCAEEIQDDAIVCRYCGRDLPQVKKIEIPPISDLSIPPISKKHSKLGLISVIISIVEFIFMVSIINPNFDSFFYFLLDHNLYKLVTFNLMPLLIPIGIIFAIVGLIRKGTRKIFPIIGLILNTLACLPLLLILGLLQNN